MDDFYIYYEPKSDAHTTGVIKAVSPTLLEEMGDMKFIRVPSKKGLEFITGTEALNYWVVEWSVELGEMCLVKQDSKYINPVAAKFLRPIPSRQEKTQMTVTWNRAEGIFNIRTRGIRITHPNITMGFFITHRDEPNILYYSFMVHLLDTMNRKGYNHKCDTEIPSEFSVYTKHELERYQLRIET